MKTCFLQQTARSEKIAFCWNFKVHNVVVVHHQSYLELSVFLRNFRQPLPANLGIWEARELAILLIQRNSPLPQKEPLFPRGSLFSLVQGKLPWALRSEVTGIWSDKHSPHIWVGVGMDTGSRRRPQNTPRGISVRVSGEVFSCCKASRA